MFFWLLEQRHIPSDLHPCFWDHCVFRTPLPHYFLLHSYFTGSSRCSSGSDWVASRHTYKKARATEEGENQWKKANWNPVTWLNRVDPRIGSTTCANYVPPRATYRRGKSQAGEEADEDDLAPHHLLDDCMDTACSRQAGRCPLPLVPHLAPHIHAAGSNGEVLICHRSLHLLLLSPTLSQGGYACLAASMQTFYCSVNILPSKGEPWRPLEVLCHCFRVEPLAETVVCSFCREIT